MDWGGREETDQIGGYRNPSRKITGAWVKAVGRREDTGNIKETELKGQSDVPAEREQKHLGWLWFLACTNPQTEASFTKTVKMARTPGQEIRSAHSWVQDAWRASHWRQPQQRRTRLKCSRNYCGDVTLWVVHTWMPVRLKEGKDRTLGPTHTEGVNR